MVELGMVGLAIAGQKLTAATPVCWRNGHIVPLEQATVSVFDHGLLYGDGVFEGIRFTAAARFDCKRIRSDNFFLRARLHSQSPTASSN